MESQENQVALLIQQADKNYEDKNWELAVQIFGQALQIQLELNKDLKHESHADLYFKYGNALLILCENQLSNQILPNEDDQQNQEEQNQQQADTQQDKNEEQRNDASQNTQENSNQKQEIREQQLQAETEESKEIKENIQDQQNEQNKCSEEKGKEDNIEKQEQACSTNKVENEEKLIISQEEEKKERQENQETDQKEEEFKQYEKQLQEGDLQLAWENLEAARICAYNKQNNKEKLELIFKIHKRLGDLQSMREHFQDAIKEYETSVQKLADLERTHSRQSAEIFFMMGNCSQFLEQPKQACIYFAQAIQVLQNLKSQEGISQEDIQQFDQFIQEILTYIQDAKTQEQDLEVVKKEIKNFFDRSVQQTTANNEQKPVKDLGVIKSKRKREEQEEGNQDQAYQIQKTEEELKQSQQGSESSKKQKISDSSSQEFNSQQPSKEQNNQEIVNQSNNTLAEEKK